MAERDMLKNLRPLAEEAFSGLRADEALRRRVLFAAREPSRRREARPLYRAVPVALCGAILLAAGLVAYENRRPAGQAFTEAQPKTGASAPAAGAAGAALSQAANPLLSEEETPFALTDEEESAAALAGARAPAAQAANAPVFAETARLTLNRRDAGPAFDAEDAEEKTAQALDRIEIEEIAAGGAQPAEEMINRASLSGAEVRNTVSRGQTLFESGSPEIPVLCVNGAVYRLLKEPEALSGGLLGKKAGAVETQTPHPSLAGREELSAGLSNCCAAGSAVYAVSSLPAGTALAAEVNGRMRLFQRVSYAGLGSAAPLSESLALSGKLREMTLSGVGTLTGDAAERVFALLLTKGERVAKEAEPGAGTLTFVLSNGLRLQMTVSGETLIACGAWQCPEFFTAFREEI